MKSNLDIAPQSCFNQFDSTPISGWIQHQATYEYYTQDFAGDGWEATGWGGGYGGNFGRGAMAGRYFQSYFDYADSHWLVVRLMCLWIFEGVFAQVIKMLKGLLILSLGLVNLEIGCCAYILLTGVPQFLKL